MADDENIDAPRPLWSERHGGSLALSKDGFGTLLYQAFESLIADNYFTEEFDWPDQRGRHPSAKAEAFFSMKLGDPWAARAITSEFVLQIADDAKLFDLIELLHREVVREHQPYRDDLIYNDDAPEVGRAALREAVNPILARRDPPLELLDNGEIVERAPEPFRRLVEQALPADAPKKEVRDRVDDAVAHFRRRGATAGDRRAAVKELADVLEFLRDDVKEHMLSEDEGALFQLANNFAIRHNKRETRRDFDEPAWLAWAFYVYLATIRLTLELRGRGDAD